MLAYSNNQENQQNEILTCVKRFFGFGDQPENITIILPSVERTRPYSLVCKNYPLFEYEMSPDDVYTALRIYSMLSLLYGDIVKVDSARELKAKPFGHCVLIGSTATNLFTSHSLENQYFHFGKNEDDHDIYSKENKIFSALLSGNSDVPIKERSIVRDYALISKCSRHGYIDVVFAGCRAHGQMAFWNILKDIDFYTRVLPKTEEKDFQILLQVIIHGYTCTEWKVLEVHSKLPEEVVPSVDPLTSQKTITWMHLSDLHFSAGSEFESSIVLEELIRDAARQANEKNIFPDFVVVTGDIAFSGNPAEYKQAMKFFDQLLKKMKLPKSRLFLVPGNHDVDRNAISREFISEKAGLFLDGRDEVNHFLESRESRQLVFQRLKNYSDFIKFYFNSKLIFNTDNYFFVKKMKVKGKKVAILGLNSAWLSGSDQNDAKGVLIGERQVRAALSQAKDSELRIALLHHPFDQLKECDRESSANQLSDECDFVLHGHIHRTKVQKLITPDGGAMIIAAGASYEKRNYPNTYNFVRLGNESGKIILRRYSDSSPGFWTNDTMTYKNSKDGIFVFDFKKK